MIEKIKWYIVGGPKYIYDYDACKMTFVMCHKWVQKILRFNCLIYIILYIYLKIIIKLIKIY